MLKYFNRNFLLIFLIVLLTTSSYSKTLYLIMLDLDNTHSFSKYFKDLKIVRGDRFIIFDAQTSQFMFEKKLLNPSEIMLYRESNEFNRLFDYDYKKYRKRKNRDFKQKKQLSALSNQKNDFARELKTIKNFIEVYNNKYKKIKTIFFGNSYLHNAYGHNFDLGMPSDGFIESNESEFNTFEDINASFVEFAIFYDTPPAYMRNKMFRFYRKLFQKKFNSRLNSFNVTATFNADKDTQYSEEPFFVNLVKIIAPPNLDSCPKLDRVIKNDLPNTGEIEIEIVNDCRKNSILSFSHNGIESQEIVDKNGRVKKTFKKEIGQNTIQYKNLKDKWHTLVNENIMNRQDGIKITLDSATSRVIITGQNPLRKDGDEFEIVYENTGAMFHPKIKSGTFKQIVPIKTGKNIFSWKDMNGVKQSKEIVFEAKCMDKVSYDETFAKDHGILKVSLENSCREENSLVTFLYNRQKYLSRIQNGKTSRNIILKYDINEIFYENFNRTTDKLATIKINDFQDLIRFMISYKDNVVVAMNIYETHVKIDSTKPVLGIDYNKTTNYRDGHIHVYNPISVKGNIWIHEYSATEDYLKSQFIQEYTQVYVTRKKKQNKGDLLFYVDYFSRHGTYGGIAPLCDERSLGGVVISYEILFDGSSQNGEKFLNPSNCLNGQPTKEDSQIRLIKKVEIK